MNFDTLLIVEKVSGVEKGIHASVGKTKQQTHEKI